MNADIPDFFAIYAIRAQVTMDRQIRRRKHRKTEMQQQEPRPSSSSPSAKKREWWRLDPNASDKYKPIEPPATPDPDLVPTLDRIVFGWEAPLSPLEQVIQEDVRRHFPKLHEWIVRRAVERAGLMPEQTSDSKLPDPALTDLDAPPDSREYQRPDSAPTIAPLDAALLDLDEMPAPRWNEKAGLHDGLALSCPVETHSIGAEGDRL